MKIRIILPAEYIPTDYSVTKPTGAKPYFLRKDGLKIHTMDGVAVFYQGKCLLQSADSCQIIDPADKLAVDCAGTDDVREFLDVVDGCEEGA